MRRRWKERQELCCSNQATISAIGVALSHLLSALGIPGDAQTLAVFCGCADFLFRILKGSANAGLQPFAPVFERCMALTRQDCEQICNQGFHPAHDLDASCAAGENLLETKMQKIVPGGKFGD